MKARLVEAVAWLFSLFADDKAPPDKDRDAGETQHAFPVWEPPLHKTGDKEHHALYVVDDDGIRHPVQITKPPHMTYPSLLALAKGLSRELFLTDISRYAVYPWRDNHSISVVVLEKGYQPGPIYLGHTVGEVRAALNIIGDERKKGRMLAFPGQAAITLGDKRVDSGVKASA